MEEVISYYSDYEIMMKKIDKLIDPLSEIRLNFLTFCENMDIIDEVIKKTDVMVVFDVLMDTNNYNMMYKIMKKYDIDAKELLMHSTDGFSNNMKFHILYNKLTEPDSCKEYIID